MSRKMQAREKTSDISGEASGRSRRRSGSGVVGGGRMRSSVVREGGTSLGLELDG